MSGREVEAKKETVNISDIAIEYANQIGVSRTVAKTQVDAIFQLLRNHIRDPQKSVKLRGIGSFSWVKRGCTNRRMPSGDVIKVPEREKLAFRPSSKV